MIVQQPILMALATVVMTAKVVMMVLTTLAAGLERLGLLARDDHTDTEQLLDAAIAKARARLGTRSLSIVDGGCSGDCSRPSD